MMLTRDITCKGFGWEMSEQTILIASALGDEHAYGPVTQILENKGQNVLLYLTDRVYAGEDILHVDLSEDGELSMSYNDRRMEPQNIHAAWMRKIGSFSLPHLKADKARQQYVTNEIRYFHEALWDLYPEEVWLNSPDRMRKANRKLTQLMLAQSIGFEIPQTILGSNWTDIENELLVDHSLMIVKMIRGVVSENDKIKSLYTHPLDKNLVSRLREYTSPFPGLYQPFIAKNKEWRVTVVGEAVFAAAIYTDESAKDDWRKHQQTSSVNFVREEFPDEAAARCLDFLGKTGLRFGAFDFIEDPEGRLIYLECNPNGQYGWLEEALGFPVSQAIASELIKIAQRNDSSVA